MSYTFKDALIAQHVWDLCVRAGICTSLCVHIHMRLSKYVYVQVHAEHVLIWYPQLQVTSFHDEEVEEEVEEEPEEADSAGGWFVEEEGDDEDDDSEMIWAL